MHTALYSADIVGEGQNGVVIGSVILHSHFRNGSALAAVNVNYIGMQKLLVLFAVYMLNKASDTALVAKVYLYALLAS